MAVGTLYFSKSQTEVWYDSDNETLFVWYDRIYKYDHINRFVWETLRAGLDLEYLERITAPLPFSVVSKVPKGLPKLVLPLAGITMYSVNSSNVVGVGYDATNERLFVQYNSDGLPIYEYSNVPVNYWNGLKNADSKGSWLHWFLKINDETFTYRKINGYNLIWSGETLQPNSGTPHPEGYMTGFETAENNEQNGNG